MPDAPPARLLDLTRLVSRQGRGPLTGIDRVELAYLRRLLDGPEACFGLVSTALGLLLLDRVGMQVVRSRADGAVPPGEGDLRSRFFGPQGARARAEAELRRLAVARAPFALAGSMLRRRLPQGATYLNVGHSNLSTRSLARLRPALGGRIGVFVHDTIPLDHPEFSSPGTPERFARKIAAVAHAADLVIYSTDHARAQAEAHLARLGRVPPALVAGLGVDPVVPDTAALPPGVDPARPYFLSVGTIEPRKAHGFLLDLWEEMHATWPEAAIPRLVIAGARGWANHDVFRRLDSLPFMGRTVIECAGLPDAAVAALTAMATALLCPTRAEGFGLPGVEAAALGCPVLCNDLPVIREVLGNYPVYLPEGDRYAWLDRMNTLLTAERRAGRLAGMARPMRAAPGWPNHFHKVLSVI